MDPRAARAAAAAAAQAQGGGPSPYGLARPAQPMQRPMQRPMGGAAPMMAMQRPMAPQQAPMQRAFGGPAQPPQSLFGMRPPQQRMAFQGSGPSQSPYGLAQPQRQLSYQGASPSPYAATAARSGAFALSDENSKQRIAELEGELARTYAALGGEAAPTPSVRQPAEPNPYAKAGSYSYEYKDPSQPGAAPGRQVGPMAQELTGIPGVVEKTPAGLAVNTDRLTMANTSEVGNLRREVDQLKKQAGALGPAKKKFDPNSRPTSPVVSEALHSFKDAPSDAQIAKKREELRAKHGGKVAAEFERFAMGWKPKHKVSIGKAEIEPNVEIGEAEIERPGT